MKNAAWFVALLVVAAPALGAQRVYTQGSDEVRVFDTPCVSVETLNRIPPNEREGWNKAAGRVSGQRFFGCWRALGDAIYILWEDGDQGVVPLEDLKPIPEA